jgi:GDPmannose 4,6-dehydratase
MYACNGILFNHESPRRGETFVTKKITRALTKIHIGLEDCLFLGNLNALRDWGHAKDYVEMQWLMLQQKKPEDYVIATGKQISVRQFVEIVASKLGWGDGKSKSIIWEGEGPSEVGRRFDTKKIVVRVDESYYRPTEVATLLGDPTKASNELDWTPKISVEDMIGEMVESDLKEAIKESQRVKNNHT